MGLFDFASIRRTVAGLEQQYQKMQNELADLGRQREALLSAPTSRDDLKAMLSNWVSASGKQYERSLQSTLAKFRNPRNMTQYELNSVMSISGAAQPFGDSIRPQDVDQALCAMFGPLLNKALLEQVDKMEWPDIVGMSMAQRAPAAGKLSERIAQLEKEITDLINSAEEAGITWSR